jgi:hypothetical protein
VPSTSPWEARRCTVRSPATRLCRPRPEEIPGRESCPTVIPALVQLGFNPTLRTIRPGRPGWLTDALGGNGFVLFPWPRFPAIP